MERSILSISLKPDLSKAIRDEAQKRNVKISAVVVEALMSHFAKLSAKPKPKKRK